MLLPIARDEQKRAPSPFDGLSNGIDAKTANVDVENGEVKLTHQGIWASVTNVMVSGAELAQMFARAGVKG
ncbi:hypothetical protein ACVWXO_006331 [Bradyrhizobium sp. LM2.7]